MHAIALFQGLIFSCAYWNNVIPPTQQVYNNVHLVTRLIRRSFPAYCSLLTAKHHCFIYKFTNYRMCLLMPPVKSINTCSDVSYTIQCIDTLNKCLAAVVIWQQVTRHGWPQASILSLIYTTELAAAF